MGNIKVRKVYIKLGTDCNLHCKYCHMEHTNIQFNSAILPVLKELGVETIAFGGGEPLVYWKYIREIVTYMGHNIKYAMVTNGTLFTQEIIDFCNQYHFTFALSLDGLNSTRDTSKPIQWNLIKQLRFCGTAVTFYKENSNIKETLESLNEIKKDYLSIKPVIWSSFPNFVHSTESTGVLSDRELVKAYVSQMTELIEKAICIYKENNKHVTIFLKRAFYDFVKKKNIDGIHCCNRQSLSILADGTICTCPYTLDKIGSILEYDKVDWEKVKQEYSRPSCKDCEIFDICGNYCCKDITDNRCYLSKQMYKNITLLMNKYNISYEEFEKNLS